METFFVLGGNPESELVFKYFIVASLIMVANIKRSHSRCSYARYEREEARRIFDADFCSTAKESVQRVGYQ